jgi:hypothetical protein
MPHPKGEIQVNLIRKEKKVKGVITLPEGTMGIFKWNGKETILKAGTQNIKQ